MTMLQSRKKPNLTLTTTQAAASLDVHRSTLFRWIAHGRVVFFRPDRASNDRQRGRKGLRILKTDWDRFVQSQAKSRSSA